ncbi:hypothetical protein MKX03_012240 [Papaver bracteatum]|nr:hypothetical protein MKX03_012240 [Papaver bracteatum]
MGRVAESSPALKRKRADNLKLSEDERKIYDLILSTEGRGIAKTEVKYKVKLITINALNKSIKSLKAKELIKEVHSEQKKHLMGNSFEPLVDVAGGVWYNEVGKLDTELIDNATLVCLKFISKSKAATVGEITEYVNNITLDGEDLFRKKFTGQEIEGLMQSLILDKEIVEAQSTGKGDFAKIPLGEQCYRCAPKRGLPKTGALASIPCGVCPSLNECTPDGIISPTTCVYFKKWFDF